MGEWIYGVGSPEGNEEIYIQRYLTTQSRSFAYFRERLNDLLILDLKKGDGWEKLCVNKSEHLEMTINNEDGILLRLRKLISHIIGRYSWIQVICVQLCCPPIIY